MAKKMTRMLKPKDVAEMLRVTRKTVVQWARDGELPAVKVGRFWRFYEDEILREINTRRT